MDYVVVLVVVGLTVAAVAVYVVLSSRAPKRERAGVDFGSLAVPRVNGMGLKPRVDSGLLARSVVEAPPPIVPPTPRSVNIASPPSAPSAPLFDIDHEPPVVTTPVEIRWSKRFDPRSGTLDETARLRLIGDLGVVGKEWCVPLLCQAYEEERRPGHRQAALTALAACRSRLASPTFRLALASDDAAERAIATDAIADLEPPQHAKPRRIVERH
jgi:hypothetical protein